MIPFTKMVCEKGKAKAYALYYRAHPRNRSGSNLSTSYRRYVYVDEDGNEHDPEYCNFRMARPQARHDHESDSDSVLESDITVSDDELSSALRQQSSCCAQDCHRAESKTFFSPASADCFYPPPTSCLHASHPACPHRPNVPLRSRSVAPVLHRPSGPFFNRLPSRLLRPQRGARDPPAWTSFPTPRSRTHFEPRLLCLTPKPLPGPSPTLSPALFLIGQITGDGFEEMPLTRKYLESGRVFSEELLNPQPHKDFRNRYQSLKLEWLIGLTRTRKKFLKVLGKRAQ